MIREYGWEKAKEAYENFLSILNKEILSEIEQKEYDYLVLRYMLDEWLLLKTSPLYLQ
jgi:hypothetical protein